MIAHGRPDRYPGVVGIDVSRESWFRDALASASGDDFSVADVARCAGLSNAPVATYAAAVREGGEAKGRPIGVLGIHFDWEPQALTVVRGVRLTPGEAGRTRVLLVDGAGRVLAASDGAGALEEVLPLALRGRVSGCDRDETGRTTAFHRTPGYETYEGLGWFGALVQG